MITDDQNAKIGVFNQSENSAVWTWQRRNRLLHAMLLHSEIYIAKLDFEAKT